MGYAQEDLVLMPVATPYRMHLDFKPEDFAILLKLKHKLELREQKPISYAKAIRIAIRELADKE
jgi:hypothetical protein